MIPVTFFIFSCIVVLTRASESTSKKVENTLQDANRIIKDTTNLRGDFSIPKRNKAEPVKSLDISAYTGTWYQVYANAIVALTFEKDLKCITATYGDIGNGQISVENYGTIGAPTGPPQNILGYAYTPDTAEPGKLRVHFNNSFAPTDGYYWIMKLGPIVDGKYEWSIVSDNLSLTLFVLARDIEDFNKNYKSKVLWELYTNLHFFFPIPTYQGKDCQYAVAPTV